MDFKQNDKTKRFVDAVKTLVNSGSAATYKEIAEKIGWHNNAMSLVVNGYRNVPPEIYKNFTKEYNAVEVEDKNAIAVQIALQNQSYLRTIMRATAEILCKQRGESFIKTLSDLEAAASAEEKLLLERLKQLSS